MRNEREAYAFLNWYRELDIPNKVLICGNHDTSIERGLITGDYIKSLGIRYLFNEDITIEGLKIWGSPITPTFGDWAFQKSRAKIGRVWESIPDDTDIVLTHGPPKGILDITNRRDNLQEQCGCNALMKRVLDIKPKAVLFGHLHNGPDIRNSGIKQLAGCSTIFSNGACCTDGKMSYVTSHGNILTIEK
jgi:Icc-related predicted phosphoesterase